MGQILSNKLNLLILILVFLLFFLESISFLDPDFGWHIKMGELILTQGVPAKDPFSYTMSSFPFVDHEWLTNTIFFLLYQNIGYLGLAIIFSAVSLFSIIIMFGKSKKVSYFSVPFILSAGALFPSVGIRPQAITWLFFSILVTFFFDKKNYKKLRFFLPAFFLIWVNLHGGFAIGIFTLLVFIFLRIWIDKKIDSANILIIGLSLLATLVNPYGIHIWREVYMQMSDTSLRWTISEWKPAIFIFNIPMWTQFSLSGILLLRFRKSFGLFEKTLYLGFLIAGLSSVRHMAFWILFSLPILSKSLSLMSSEASKIKYGKERFKKAYSFLVLFVITIVILPIVFLRQDFLPTEESFYPSKAIDFIKKHPSSGQMFSDHGWGGYLIWNYPEKKVFVDGRMNSWRWNKSLKNESNYAFREYRDLLSGKTQISYAVEKYNIDTFLLPIQIKKEKTFLDALSNKLEAKIFKKDLPAGRQGKYDSIYTQLEKGDWRVIYKDEISIVYRKK